jgi:hypothetical protein
MWRFVLIGALAVPLPLQAERVASLRGSPASMQEQNQVARQHGLPFYRTAAEIREAAARGDLAELGGDDNYEVADFVRYPYLHPAAALFVERLAAQYREACGQKLVVTSAVRPSSGQPANSHRLSVHPAGMAVDLRVSDRASCRSWLESAILNLERSGVINGIREHRPPHYHIAVFPEQYLAYAAERIEREEEEERRVRLAEADALDALQAVASGYADHPGAAAGGEGGGGGGGSLRISLAAVILAVPVSLGYLLRRRGKSADDR